MKTIQLVLMLIVMSVSVGSSAAVIDFAGFSRDTANNFFQGNGLHWRFADEDDYLRGLSSDGKFSGESLGWRAASNAEVASMMNAFDVWAGGSFIADEELWQGEHGDWGSFSFSNLIEFYAIMMGGYPIVVPGDSWSSSFGLPHIRFGEDQNSNGRLNTIEGFAEWLNWENIPSEYRGPIEDTYYNSLTGMRLVPDSILFGIKSDSMDDGNGPLLLVRYVVAVPEPAPVVLFGTSLFILAIFRKFKCSKRLSGTHAQIV